MDDSGQVFDDDKLNCLAEALVAVEKGRTVWFKEVETERKQ